jgi:hypothetical protein
MNSNRLGGYTPILLIFSADNKMVGIAPLMTTRKFGVRFIRPLNKNWYSPDFIIDDRYRETCIAKTIEVVFKRLHCQYVELIFPVESPNLRILKQTCNDKKIYCWSKPDMGHCIIPIEKTWDEFIKARGWNFRRRFRRIEKKLNTAGSWSISREESPIEESEAIHTLFSVDKRSWKEDWRRVREMEDQDLINIVLGSLYTARIEPHFKWSIWFLELNTQAIAYSLLLQFKELALIMKTSYDKRYKKLFPGIYVNNALIRELFENTKIKRIDWLTDLEFHRNWTTICLPRVRVLLSQKGLISPLLGFTLASTSTRKLLSLIQDPLILRNNIF